MRVYYPLKGITLEQGRDVSCNVRELHPPSDDADSRR